MKHDTHAAATVELAKWWHHQVKEMQPTCGNRSDKFEQMLNCQSEMDWISHSVHFWLQLQWESQHVLYCLILLVSSPNGNPLENCSHRIKNRMRIIKVLLIPIPTWKWDLIISLYLNYCIVGFLLHVNDHIWIKWRVMHWDNSTFKMYVLVLKTKQ